MTNQPRTGQQWQHKVHDDVVVVTTMNVAPDGSVVRYRSLRANGGHPKVKSLAAADFTELFQLI